MSRFPVRSDTQPGESFLRDLDRVETPAVEVQRVTTRFIDRVLRLQPFGELLNEEPAAVSAAPFLVGYRGEYQITLQRKVSPFRNQHRHQSHGGHVLHVDGSTAIKVAVVNDRSERWLAPAI